MMFERPEFLINSSLRAKTQSPPTRNMLKSRWGHEAPPSPLRLDH
jgi:hypothetical protein